MKRLILTACILLAAGVPAAAQDCQVVHEPYATLSDDGGLSFLLYRGAPVTQSSLTWGLAATEVPGLLYMQAANAVWVSEDDGCNWTRFGATSSDLFRIATGSGDVAYAWPENGGKFVYKLEPNGGRTGYVTTANVAPEPRLRGFAVDANDSSHVRAVGQTGQIWESFQGGAAKTWVAIGEAASPEAGLSYFATFNPNDLDHVVFGQVIEGGFVTFDGGQSWDRSLFFFGELPGSGTPPGRASERVNFFTAVVSPVDGSIVYGRAINLEESENGGDPFRARHVYLSTDGGLSFVPVIDDVDDGVRLPNQPLMVADRDDANILNLVLSQSPLFGGTNFYRYDRSTDTVQTTNNPYIPIVRSIAFSPANPGRIIVGFQIVAP